MKHKENKNTLWQPNYWGRVILKTMPCGSGTSGAPGAYYPCRGSYTDHGLNKTMSLLYLSPLIHLGLLLDYLCSIKWLDCQDTANTYNCYTFISTLTLLYTNGAQGAPSTRAYTRLSKQGTAWGIGPEGQTYTVSLDRNIWTYLLTIACVSYHIKHIHTNEVS